MFAANSFRHWHGSQDEQGIVWLIFDRADSSANTIDMEVLKELYSILDQLKEVIRPQGLVIRSGKSSGFIAGADVNAFKDITKIDAAREVIEFGQSVFAKLSELEFSTVALIEGFCLGGGYELALACKYRVALDDERTKIGLPEILLGIQPGWGGTVRLPRLLGSLKALELIITGKTLAARAAVKIGMVDAAVPERHLMAAVQYYLTAKPELRETSWWNDIIQLDIVRPLVGKLLKYQISKKVVAKHYPAPYTVINTWVHHAVTQKAAFAEEVNSFCKLAATANAKNLIRVFFLRERLKKLSKQVKFKAERVHVIGAGVMGGDIAAWCALSGLSVTLEDNNINAMAQALLRAKQLFTKNLKQPHLIQAAQDRLQPDVNKLGRATADLVIEAIFEDKAVKQQLFVELEQQVKPQTILATNTSTIPLAELSEVLSRPERLVGLHFFNPVAKMPLLEVIYHTNSNPAKATAEEYINKSLAFAGQIGKLPLPVTSVPGFLVNRLLIPYMLESTVLLEEGIPVAVIDKAALEFGMMMGPFELADTIGLDVCAHGSASLNLPLPEPIQKLIKQGKLGKKTGAGFYKYKHNRPIKLRSEFNTPIPADTADRLILRIINEAVAALREGIVADQDLLDAGMIFGGGFAPFLGGPMQYIADQKYAAMKQRLDQLAERYGSRFSADVGWASLVH